MRNRAAITELKRATGEFLNFPNTTHWAGMLRAMQQYADEFHEMEERQVLTRFEVRELQK